jgi:hypothetical protein
VSNSLRSLVWIAAALSIVLAGAVVTMRFFASTNAITFHSTYQAILLDNGQVFFGRLEGYGTPRPLLTEVYYVQTSVNSQTRETNNTLLKRGREWHGPDRMWLNPEHIVFVEPVGKDSRVAQLIVDLNKQ